MRFGSHCGRVSKHSSAMNYCCGVYWLLIVDFLPTFLDVAVLEGFVALILAGQGGGHLFLDSRHCLCVVDVLVVVVGVREDEGLREKEKGKRWRRVEL